MLFSLRLQRWLSMVCLPLVGLGVWMALRIRGLEISNISAVRRRFRELSRSHSGPLLVCSNHLTMVDSALVIWAMGSFWHFFWRPSRLPWNVPEAEHLEHSRFLRALCYLAKCIPIRRSGSAEHRKAVTEQLQQLLGCGETVALFPEGKRSRSGRLETEDFGYGVGELATRVDGVLIVCIYVRGHHQEGCSTMPPAGDTIHAEVQVVEPETPHQGRRAARDISQQVIGVLAQMEERFFTDTRCLEAPETGHQARASLETA